jgi:hypothetical protein
LAKRPRFSRWRRLPGAYRTGDEKWPDPNDEPQRITLFVSGHVFDRAAEQAERLGFPNAQDYCTDLVVKAIEAERVRSQVANVEARRGPLEGFHAIADDPEYLAELQAAGSSHEVAVHPDSAKPAAPAVTEVGVPTPIEAAPRGAESAWSPAALVVLRHAGLGEPDPSAFLPALRRGEPVPSSEVAELAQALHQLEAEYRGVPTMGRALTFALHRLAFESQILHTDAWPDRFDVWTVDMLRSVQEAVERILSGQDIRYYANDDGPTAVHGPPSPTPTPALDDRREPPT